MALLAIPTGSWSLAGGQYLSANMSTRGEIMAYIAANPGIYLRELSEDLGLSMGVVQYHVWVLTRRGEVEEYRSGRYRRFFGAAKYQEADRMVISLLRQGTAGRILTLLSGEQSLTHTKLATILGVTSQALTWQMKRLRTMGVVRTSPSQNLAPRSYCLVDDILQRVQAVVGQMQDNTLNPIRLTSVG